jgi:hypothetical protein
MSFVGRPSASVAPVEAGGFEVLAASLRADARDLDAFLEVLAGKLSAAFPGNTEVDREGFRCRGSVKSISVSLGENRYRLERNSAGVTCLCARSVRGIVLKNEEFDLDDWITSLSRDLAEASGPLRRASRSRCR